jgi:hypothetical protein
MKSVKLKLHMFSSIFAYKLAYFTVETITVGGQRTKLQVTRTALCTYWSFQHGTLRFYCARMYLISIRKGSRQIRRKSSERGRNR